MIASCVIAPHINRVDFRHDFLKLTKDVINNGEYSGAILVTAFEGMNESKQFSFIICILPQCYTDMQGYATFLEPVALTEIFSAETSLPSPSPPTLPVHQDVPEFHVLRDPD